MIFRKKKRKAAEPETVERVISYDRLIAALDSLVGPAAPTNLWEQGYDDCLAQVYDLVACIVKEDGV